MHARTRECHFCVGREIVVMYKGDIVFFHHFGQTLHLASHVGRGCDSR